MLFVNSNCSCFLSSLTVRRKSELRPCMESRQLPHLPHVAIGTSAIAVATNAAINLSNHARGGTVIWSCALVFAAAGIVGAFGGSILGKMVEGQKLLALFALIMLVIAMLMLKTRSRIGLPDVKISMSNMPAIVGLGMVTGTMSGFFGIGGGCLVVPALLLAMGRPSMSAASSSLVAVTAFGLNARPR